MVIAESIQGFPGEKKLKIGSSAGFFYVGTVQDFTEREKEIDNQVRLYFKKKKIEAEKARKELLERDMSVNAYATGCREPNLEGYIARITGWFGLVRKANQRLENTKVDLARYVKLGEREVLRCEEADPAADKDCLIVVLEGSEIGCFWTTDEGKLGSVSLMGEEEEIED